MPCWRKIKLTTSLLLHWHLGSSVKRSRVQYKWRRQGFNSPATQPWMTVLNTKNGYKKALIVTVSNCSVKFIGRLLDRFWHINKLRKSRLSFSSSPWGPTSCAQNTGQFRSFYAYFSHSHHVMYEFAWCLSFKIMHSIMHLPTWTSRQVDLKKLYKTYKLHSVPHSYRTVSEISPVGRVWLWTPQFRERRGTSFAPRRNQRSY